MSNDVYLGDMDPNNRIVSTLSIRRHFLFQLLMWDSIVISDSQFLTDPRINILMAGYDDDERLLNTYGFSGVSEYQKGIEKLIESGMVKIAFRQQGTHRFNAVDLWKEMSSRPGKKVPFLPEDIAYSEYIDSIGSVKDEQKSYQLDNMEARFRRNLLTGLGSSLILNPADDIDRELNRLMHERVVWFSSILDFIRQQKQLGKLSEQRYKQIYDYVFSCYSINISAETECFLNTKIQNIPLHIESGIGDYSDNIPQVDLNRMRPTWALNPAILDFITFEDFIELRKTIENIVRKGDILRFCTGTIQEGDWNEFCDVWDSYTKLLELAIDSCIHRSAYRLQSKILEENLDGWKRLVNKPEQSTILFPTMEIVKNLLNYVPILSDVLAIGDTVRSVAAAITCFSNRKGSLENLKRYQQMNDFLQSNTGIITKYK